MYAVVRMVWKGGFVISMTGVETRAEIYAQGFGGGVRDWKGWEF